MRRKKLFRQLFITILTVAGIAAATVSWYAAHAFRQFYYDTTARELEAQALIAEGEIAALLRAGKLPELQEYCTAIASRTGTRFTVVLPDGTVLADSHEDPLRMDNHADRPEIIAALQDRVTPSVRYSYTLRQQMAYVAIPLRHNNSRFGILRAAIPVTSIEAALTALRHKIVVTAIVLLVATTIAAWFLARRLSRPLLAMRTWAEQFAAGKTRGSLPTLTGPEEMANLASTLNTMATQVEGRIRHVTQQHNELEAVFASMVEGVITIDNDEHIQSFNQAAVELLRIDPAKAKGKSTLEVLRNIELQRFLKKALSSSTPVEGEVAMHDATGRERLLYTHGVQLKNSDGQPQGALIVLNDLTNLRRLENVRQEFVANVSHELKTPITSIEGFVETLLDGAINDQENARRFLEIIHKQSKRLSAIVEDLLALSRLEQGTEKEEIALTLTPLKDTLRSAIQTCTNKAEKKEITISLQADEALQALINPPLLEQAVVNLVDNAVKYSPKGSTIEVEARQAGESVVIAVRDQGVGVAAKDQPRLFERFYRVDKARSKTLGGTGLGLSIVKHIIQAHGGQIMIESSLGKGSTFSILLRNAAAPDTATAPPAH